MTVIEQFPIIIDQDNVLVDARLLHRKLQSGQQFSNWIKSRIDDYGFVENQDFYIIFSKSTGGRQAVDYHLTLAMAQELAMLERNEIGRSIRRWFIAKAKEAHNLPAMDMLFKGLKAKRLNDREMYPYREILERAGYTRNANGGRAKRYWMHFAKEGKTLFVTAEFALHLYHQKQVLKNRAVMLAAQPVLPFCFGDPAFLPKGGAK